MARKHHRKQNLELVPNFVFLMYLSVLYFKKIRILLVNEIFLFLKQRLFLFNLVISSIFFASFSLKPHIDLILFIISYGQSLFLILPLYPWSRFFFEIISLLGFPNFLFYLSFSFSVKFVNHFLFFEYCVFTQNICLAYLKIISILKVM